MPFLTEVHFQNYRSFLDAKCRLSPVTVVIGANNSGKSNFLRGIETVAASQDPARSSPYDKYFVPHRTSDGWHGADWLHNVKFTAVDGKGRTLSFSRYVSKADPNPHDAGGGGTVTDFWDKKPVRCTSYRLKEECIGGAERDSERPFVHPNGEGTTRVLQRLSLKHKKVFAKVEEAFRKFVPEAGELTFERADEGKWFLEVLETGAKEPVPLSELSEGSRMILALLTILHQPERPDIILLEDVEHAIHPRGLKPMVEMIRQISKEHGVQVIMTTQAPYVLDSFQPREFWGDVVIVEKTNGVSRLTNADERLIALGYEREMRNVPLGDMWFSGILGGMAGPNKLWDEPTPDPEKP